MKNMGIRLSLFLFIFGLGAADTPTINPLEKYRDFIEEGTYVGFNKSLITPVPKSRYYTFKQALQHFIDHQGKIIVELGTSRSFVHGGLPGCNSNDIRYWTPSNPNNWDWSAGFFTRVAGECIHGSSALLHTVDLASDHLQRCCIMTADIAENIRYYHCSSLDFLASCTFDGGIDLLYLDTGDMTPIEPTARLQLAEAKLIVARDLMAPNGIILIDDVKNQTPREQGDMSGLGKSKYALPYLLEHGFELIADEYQIIVRKRS